MNHQGASWLDVRVGGQLGIVWCDYVKHISLSLHCRLVLERSQCFMPGVGNMNGISHLQSE